jgi:hypothetical protein
MFGQITEDEVGLVGEALTETLGEMREELGSDV